jgi:hypothetical protein
MSPRGWGSKREFIYRREPTHCQGPHAPTISWESAEREREREREGEREREREGGREGEKF